MEPISLHDDGYVPVTITAADGQPVMHVIDLFEAYAALGDLHRQHAGEGKPADAYARAVAEWLSSKGFPQVSLLAALRFDRAVFDALERAKKNDRDASMPASPASTDSTPGS